MDKQEAMNLTKESIRKNLEVTAGKMRLIRSIEARIRGNATLGYYSLIWETPLSLEVDEYLKEKGFNVLKYNDCTYINWSE